MAENNEKTPAKISANALTKVINDHSEFATDTERQIRDTLREFLFPTIPPGQDVTAKAVSNRLKRHANEPVKKGETTFILRRTNRHA